MQVADFGYGVSYIPTADEENAARSQVLASFKTQLERCRVDCGVPEVRTGAAVVIIPATARALEADLIVTGLGAHDFLDRAFGSETALRLAQTVTTPIVAIPATATGAPHRVIVAMDFSATSRRAAEVVSQWLRSGDELRLVHVVEGGSEPEPEVGPAVRAEMAAAIAETLTKVANDLRVPSGVTVKTVILHGNPARTLLVYAKEIHADLIALGSHGYGPLRRLVLGSVAAKVMRLGSIGVLVVPPMARGAHKPSVLVAETERRKEKGERRAQRK
jgi:nucleotide-binding universal stress UspA family protein